MQLITSNTSFIYNKFNGMKYFETPFLFATL